MDLLKIREELSRKISDKFREALENFYGGTTMEITHLPDFDVTSSSPAIGFVVKLSPIAQNEEPLK